MKRLQFREFEIAKHHNPEEAAIDSKTKATYKSICYSSFQESLDKQKAMIMFIHRSRISFYRSCLNNSEMHQNFDQNPKVHL